MNNNSEQISNYLQGQMSADERKAFEEQLASDKELQHEVAVQRRVIAVAINAGLKAEFAKAIRKKTIIKKITRWGIAACIIGAAILLFNIVPGRFSNKQDLTDLQSRVSAVLPFIAPPLQNINVPLSEYFFDADKGDTIFHPSGSIIYFPPFALVDGSGNPIKGKVRVTYREFNDPLDFFVSGIPMSYDSAGKKYNFESSGMCEINAYKDNKAVFINQQAKPQINLSAKNKSPLHNVYFLDTVARNWKFMGKDTIAEVKKIALKKIVEAEGNDFNDYSMPVKPVKPALASEDRQSFSIEIEPGSFEELFVYDKLKFEVVDESTYRRSDANEHWDNMKLEHSNKEGIYNIILTNTARKITYKVRPVLEGADYDAALKVFNQKNELYKDALKSRLVMEKDIADSISLNNKQLLEKMNADRKENDRINALVIARNKSLREQWQQNFDVMREKYMKNLSLNAEIIRSFAINNFGVWNCDHPQFPDYEIPILASYTDSANVPVSLVNVAVVYKGFNGITQFAGSQIRVIPGQENMLWSVIDGSFYYFSYNDFKAAAITRGQRSFIFRMRRSGQEISAYEEIRKLVEKL